MVDASNTAVGAVLQQQVKNSWQPISFFSRSLSPRERKYSTFDRELLATFLAVKHYLHNPHFHILTDHKPLIYAINSINTQHSPRQARQLNYISQFATDIFKDHRILWLMLSLASKLTYLFLPPQCLCRNLRSNNKQMLSYTVLPAVSKLSPTGH